MAAERYADALPGTDEGAVGLGALATEVAPAVVFAEKKHIEADRGKRECKGISKKVRVKITTKTIRERKGVTPITALTAYDFPTAVHADEAGIDLILVGDSVGNTVLGFPSTVAVTLEMMEHHAAAVLRAVPDSLVVVDLPFAEASLEREHILRAARRFIQMGAGAVKLEGGENQYDLRAYLIDAGVPVLGHVGLLPQRVQVEGGYRRYGRDPEEAEQIIADAESVEASGCFACIIEMVDPILAGDIREKLEIPLIGIGSGGDCDGQILVSHDMLGLGCDKPPSFVKTYADLGQQIRNSFEAYREDVIHHRFPS